MKKRILAAPFLVIIIFIFVGVGVAGAAIYFGTTSGGETNTEGINLQKGLVGHWKFDGNAKDSTANSNHGTVTGATLTTDRKGQMNKAYSFDGNDYIDAGSGASLAVTNAFTLEAWINPSNMAGCSTDDVCTIWSNNGAVDGGDVIGIKDSSGTLWYYTLQGGWNSLNADSAVTINTWQHVVFTYSGSQKKIYVNGVEKASNDETDSMRGLLPVWIGRKAGSHDGYFPGLVDDVRIYNRALSATEVTALYQEYDPGIAVSDLQKGLVGHWKLDGNAKDSTANSKHGTVTGATLTTDRKGQVNKAYSFDGITNKVSMTPPSSTAFTVSFWMKSSLNLGFQLFHRSNAGGRYYVSDPSGAIFGRIQHSDDSYDSYQLTATSYTWLNTWRHVVIAFDGTSNINTYIDGNFDRTTNIVTYKSWSGAIDFGYANDIVANYYSGIMDDVRIYNRALSATEVTALYQEYDPGIAVSDLQKGLVGHWKLDGNAKDSTANSKHGTVTGTTLTTDRKGQLNKAYSFDGLDDYIVAGNMGIPQNGPATLSGWFYLTQGAMSKSDHNYLWGAHAPGTGEDAILYQHKVNNYLYMPGADYFIAPLPLNQWLHIVLTYSGDTSTAKLYVNNVSYAMNLQAGASNITALSNFRISSYYSTANYAWSGSIDDVRVYNRVLSQAEITALYESY